MAIYPVPTANDTAGFYELFRYVNTVSEGYFILLPVLLVTWVVTFIALRQYGNSRAWTTSSFICMVISIPLAVANLIGAKWAYLMVLFVGIGAVWIKLEARG